jgi:hypothetical protein
MVSLSPVTWENVVEVIAMKMPEVETCDVTECYYNRDNMCHANAITVGSPCPRCDTYIKSPEHSIPADIGLVGACHESDCKFNQQLSCQAPGIHVGHHMEHADCKTYSPVQMQ